MTIKTDNTEAFVLVLDCNGINKSNHRRGDWLRGNVSTLNNFLSVEGINFMTVWNWSEINGINGSRFLGVGDLWLIVSLHILVQSIFANGGNNPTLCDA